MQLNDSEARHIRGAVLDGSKDFASGWLHDKNLEVLTLEEIPDLAVSDELRLLASRSSELIAMTTDELGDADATQAVKIPAADVGDWYWEHAPFDVLIANPGLTEMLLVTVDEYALLAGPHEMLVEVVSPESLDSARARFDEYASEMADASRHLTAVAKRYNGVR